MFSTFSRSWELVKQSFNVLKSDRELLLFPFISMIGVILVTIVFSIPLFFTGLLQNVANGQNGSNGTSILGYVLLFVFYLVMYTIIIYSKVALVGAAMIRLKVANSKIGHILGYAAISATVGVVLSAIRDKNNVLTSILAGVINFAWNVLTFLVIPVLVVENIGPIDAIKRSGALLKKTWGEQIVANGGIGLVFGLISFLLIVIIGGPLLVLGITTESAALIVGAIVVMILIGAIIGLVSSALSGIFQAALYNYATTDESNQFFDPALLQTAFKPKG
jgi:Family of unknown function (DUF6159)